MSRLERVYLANVVLYFKSFSDVKRFKLVNKKCYDSVEMLHIYSCKSIHSTKTKPSDSIQKKSFDEWVNSFIPEDLFEVQPNTETITLSAIDQCVHSQSVIKKVKRSIALDGAIC
ncbi:hypothetical protein EIN_184810, partial [Entamoeba invadens IP1]|uniref:hypothetical protein n=1 Tax=Entamoeba invadens IP1 TaxID=370355 RepID=UPI0002C3CFA9